MWQHIDAQADALNALSHVNVLAVRITAHCDTIKMFRNVMDVYVDLFKK